MITDMSTDYRNDYTTTCNKDREPVIECSSEQPVFIRNPVASQQKFASRYTH